MAKRHSSRFGFASLLTLALHLSTGAAMAAVTQLSAEPVQTASPVVKPNVLFILDDSGSMARDYMPDWARSGGSSKIKHEWESNSAVNSIYYDPAIWYRPPSKGDGTSYPSLDTEDLWKNVPDDGFGVQSDKKNKVNLIGQAFYHYFKPDHFCKAEDLRQCVEASSATATHPYPALLRWCRDATPGWGRQLDCRATYIEGLYADPLVPEKTVRVGINQNETYGDKGADKKAKARLDCAGSRCTYAEEMSNFANWWAYYRTRMQMAKSAASLAFADINEKVRIGFMTINNATKGGDFLNVKDAGTASGGHKLQWYNKLLAAKPDGGTPLRKALTTAGHYYAGKLLSIYDVTAEDPVQYACQRHYTMLSTDGYWNDAVTPMQLDEKTAIDDQDGKAGTARPFYDAHEAKGTLADVAQYFYATDIRSPDAPLKNATGALGLDVANNDSGQQRMFTSTIGMGASGTLLYRSDYATSPTGDYADIANGSKDWPEPSADRQSTIDDLWHAAVNGRGTYYSAANPDDLRIGLQAFIKDAAEGGAITAVTAPVSNRNLSQADNIAFKPAYVSGSWYGDLIAIELDPETGGDTDYAFWSVSEAYAKRSGKTAPALDGRDYTKRNIYTADPAKIKGTPKAFQWDQLSDAMKSHFREASIKSLSQFCVGGPGCVLDTFRFDSDTPGEGSGIGGVNLVNYLRGDTSREGKERNGFYRVRKHRLGDITEAQPIYVRRPRFNYLDKGYGAFRQAQASRQAMVYAPANDGMVHAFRAATGEEAWAYIPSILLPKLYKLADKNYETGHQNFINATPQHGDIQHDDSWYTIMVGGFGEGARGYYALDITNPEAPKVLWEFTHSAPPGTAYTVDSDLGYTYGTPIITKLSDGTWLVIVTSGYNNVSPGSGRGMVWILDAYTGAILHKLSTGKGSNPDEDPIPGCAKSPCPSGLAHLRAYSDTANTNNTASRLYGGDLLGHLWRFDISRLTAAKDSTATVQLMTTLIDLGNNRQPVTSAPELGNVKGTPVVFVGTGRYLGDTDVASTDMQSFYAIKDTLAPGDERGLFPADTPRQLVCPNSKEASHCFVQNATKDVGETRELYNPNTDVSMNFGKMHGWFFDMYLGERVIYKADLQDGNLSFTSVKPSSPKPCMIEGDGVEYTLDYATGLKAPGVDVAGILLKGKPGTGLVSAAMLVRIKNGKLAVRTNRGLHRTIEGGSTTSTRRISWRELITE